MIEALVAVLLGMVPAGAHVGRESPAEVLARYQSIAADLVEVAGELGGEARRDELATLAIGIAVHESGLRRDVDEGRLRGSGVDACLMQIRTSRKRGDELSRDRRACFRAGLSIAMASLEACARLPERERLAAYASGSCDRGRGVARDLWRDVVKARRLFALERERWAR